MTFPEAIYNKYLERFNSLIAEAERIEQATRETMGPEFASEGFRALVALKTSVISLFHQVIPANSPLRDVIEELKTPEEPMKVAHVYGNVLARVTSYLKAVKSDFEDGMLDDLSLQIEAEIAGDYLSQAQQLLSEGGTGSYDHVPAAVLSGAVLEKSLRTLCDQQNPPISHLSPSGRPKTLDPLITDLKKAGVFNENKAQQLRAWAGIRNAAAHGRFSDFNRNDVETMLLGVQNFLANHLP